MLRPGVFLQDRYEILEQIGSGGMSVVYKAKCHKLNRLVAIKVLKEEFSSDSNFVSKFKMEAQAAAGLSHPNIVSVYDVIDEGKLHYIVMELIEGITLKTYISKKGKLEVKESIGIAIQVAQGIAAAHEQHIIHRDIKPQNMIISRDGKVKVADFGIARAVSAQTLNSAAMGSVHYISPEQARGGFSDERSDLYSLGITMYEMVTGRVPFEGENTVAIALAHLEDAMVPPSVYTPEIPVSLERIILKCTEKKPERRYASANEVIADLRKSLIQPDGGFVDEVTDAKALEGKTVHISNKQLAQIKERENKIKEEDSYTRRKEGEEKPHTEPDDRKKRRRTGNGQGRRRQEDEVNPQIERLLAGAGIVVAIMIVSVLIVVFSKLGGLFQAGSGLLHKESTAESGSLLQDHTETESGLKDTEVYMPDVLDLPEDLAEAKLKEHFLSMKRTYEHFDDVEKGNIARQEPDAGTVVAKWSHVNVVVSSGSEKISLSELGIDSMDAEAAKSVLESKLLTVKTVEEESETVAVGKVVRYEPELAAEGGTVTLYISTGPRRNLIPVPGLVGKTEEEAIAMLAEAGLSPGDTSTRSSEAAKGTIIEQSGGENGMIEAGGKISYVVSSGPEVKKQRYVASIDNVYDLSNLIGPGAGTASLTLSVRLHQVTNGQDVYKTLMEPRTIVGDVLLPISYTSIESMNGTDQGELEVVDESTGNVLKTYPLTFFRMD